MNAADLQLLLRDVHVLAQYAARGGKLPLHSKAFETIAALEAEPTLANDTAMVAQLHNEIDALAKAVAPVTLKQLLRRGSFVNYARDAIANLTPFAIGLLTLLLTLYLAFQSSQLHQADTALREYQEWVTQQPKEKLYTAWKMYRYERVLNVREPPLAQLDAYQKLVEDARQLVDKGSAIQIMLQESAALLWFPTFLEYLAPGFIAKLNGGVVRVRLDDLQYSGPSIGMPGRQIPASSTGVPAPQIPAGGTGVPAPQRLDCKEEPMQGPLNVALKTTPQQRQAADIDAYFSSYACFLSRLHISQETISYSPWPVIYQTKSKVNLLVTWLLPGLYGLLGACVYLMRDLVLLREGRFGRDKSILSMLSLLLRVALGGLAGIIIGWFWVPTSIGSGTAVAPISSIPFGIAFLAGFSIETLFSLLDRLNKTVENRDAPKP